MAPLELLRTLLRADTRNPPGAESEAAEILREHLDRAGMKTQMLARAEGRPNLVATLEGPRDKAPLVLLSHTDVVPVEEEHWSHDPFGADIDAGCVWGRGALDMKGVAVLHAHAATRFAESARDPARTLIVCAVADEETGGDNGARWLLEEHPDAAGFHDGGPPPEVLGEGGFGLSGVIDVPVMPVVLGEKQAVWVNAVARGDPGHASLPPDRQAPVALTSAIRRLNGWRRPRVHPIMREQFAILSRASSGARGRIFSALASGAGDSVASVLRKPLRSSGAIAALLSDTVTCTTIEAGYKHNVVPGEVRASFDCRLLPDTDVESFLASLHAAAARHDTTIHLESAQTGPVSRKGELYDALVAASSGLPERPVVVPSLSPGFTDVRFWRRRGATGYGWVPFVLDRELLATVHGHDERVPVAALEQGAEAMAEVVASYCGR